MGALADGQSRAHDGNANHFKNYAKHLVDDPQQLAYGTRRFVGEVDRPDLRVAGASAGATPCCLDRRAASSAWRSTRRPRGRGFLPPRRWSSARGFLKPVLDRANLRLEKNVLVDRLIVENGRAVGVTLAHVPYRSAAAGIDMTK